MRKVFYLSRSLSLDAGKLPGSKVSNPYNFMKVNLQLPVSVNHCPSIIVWLSLHISSQYQTRLRDANCSAPQGCGDVRPSRIIKALRHVYQIKACPPPRDLAVPMNCSESFTYLCTTAPGSLPTWYRTNQIARFDSCITDSTQEA